MLLPEAALSWILRVPLKQYSHIYVMFIISVIHLVFQCIGESRPISSAAVNLKTMTSMIRGDDAERHMWVSLLAGAASGR